VTAGTRNSGNFLRQRDLRVVQWGATAQLNILRALIAGLVWTVLLLAATAWEPAGLGALWWVIPLLTIALLLGLVLLFLPTAWLMSFVPWNVGPVVVNAVNLVAGLAVLVGDPLVFMLCRRWPALVPAGEFRPFNWALVVFVRDPAGMRWRRWY
jgi:hypothetical protein